MIRLDLKNNNYNFDASTVLYCAMLPSTVLQVAGIGLHCLASIASENHIELARDIRWAGHQCLQLSTKVTPAGYVHYLAVASIVPWVVGSIFENGDSNNFHFKFASNMYLFHCVFTETFNLLFELGWENNADNFGMPMNQYLANH